MNTVVCEKNGLPSIPNMAPASEMDDDDIEILEVRMSGSRPSKRHKPDDNSDRGETNISPSDQAQASENPPTLDPESNPVPSPERSISVQTDHVEISDKPVDLEKESAAAENQFLAFEATPSFTQTEFLFGPYVPIIKAENKIIVNTSGVVDDFYRFTSRDPIKKRLIGEILPDDSILEVPSLVTPLLLKKNTVWPPKYRESDKTSEPDDVEIVKIVERNDRQDIITQIEPRFRKPEDYIRDTVINSLTKNSRSLINQDRQQDTILAIDDYYRSPAGQLLYSIGLSLVTEFNMDEQLRKLSSRMRKGETGLISEYDALKATLIRTKTNNRPFKHNKSKNCHICFFKSPFLLVLDHHLEKPHKSKSRLYMCNWCEFKNKESSQIVYHNHVAHKKYRCRQDTPIQVHCCRYCQFETNSKKRYTTHIIKCEKVFQSEFNMALDDPDNYPAITSKCITQSDIRTYESTLRSLRLSAYNPHQIKVSSSAQGIDGLPILLVPKSSPAAEILERASKRQQSMPISEASNPYHNPGGLIGQGLVSRDQSSLATQDQPVAPNLLRLLATNITMDSLPSNRAVILQHPRPQSAFVNGMSVAKNTQEVVMPPPNRSSLPKKTTNALIRPSGIPTIPSDIIHLSRPNNIDNNGGKFVICEICDAYIDDIRFFKSHMQWVHKVKIHTKVLETLKPPLNCQKCNWRYFTDQGLERHLLGSHGLITSNMQELVDHEKDSGRCTICGVRCPKKLVSHIKDVHKINLKPAQLSYKCTVCAATFCLYRHFENHVYRVHGST